MDSLRRMIVEDPHYFLLLPSTKQAALVDKMVQRLVKISFVLLWRGHIYWTRQICLSYVKFWRWSIDSVQVKDQRWSIAAHFHNDHCNLPSFCNKLKLLWLKNDHKSHFFDKFQLLQEDECKEQLQQNRYIHIFWALSNGANNSKLTPLNLNKWHCIIHLNAL